MKFTKMQGLGNDYVYVNCLKEKVESPSEMARRCIMRMAPEVKCVEMGFAVLENTSMIMV